jgi:hypothetical protein
MNSAGRHIVCPHCNAVNRVPPGKAMKEAKCGRCKAPLFVGTPAAVSAASFTTHIQRFAIMDTATRRLNALPPREGWIPVRFPPPPALAKGVSRFGSGRIFPLFSRVMREGLSTAGAGRPGSSL